MEHNRQELEQQLCDLIAIPSVRADASEGAPFGKETVRALELFLSWGEAYGFKTKMLDGYAGYIEWPGQDTSRYVAAVCHLDVVPAGDWEDAFRAKVLDDRIVGRGSIDDKGPALACLHALVALKNEGFVPPVSIRLILGLDEESGSACLEHYNEVEPAPVAAFTADADFPVIFAEKGSIHFTWHGKRRKNHLLRMEAGTRPNVVPGVCRAWIQTENGVEEKVFYGEQAHASTPQLGVNAISVAVPQLIDLLITYGERDDFLDFFLRRFDIALDGQGLGMTCSDPESGYLTCSAGVLKLTEGEWELTCDLRCPVTVRMHNITNQIKNVAKEEGVQVSIDSLSEHLYYPREHALVSSLLDVYKKVTGDVLAEPIAIGGGTYARDLPNCVAFGPVFPGEECLCHQTDEYILRETLHQATAIYTEAFRTLALEFGNKKEEA